MAIITEVQLQDGSVHQLGGGGTYTLTKSGSTITLTGSGGDVSSVTDSDTTYTFSVSGNTLTITPSSGSPQTVTLPDDDTTYSISISGNVLTLTGSDGSTSTVTVPDTTYELERNLETITHMLFVDMDGLGYEPSEDNLVVSNDGYEYLEQHYPTDNFIYIVDTDGNDIPNISNVNLADVPLADRYTFGQALYDYFETALGYRLKINGELTQRIMKFGASYLLTQELPPYDMVTAERWYQDGDVLQILATGVVVDSHNTIDLVGSDGTTSSVAIKATDIGALPSARYHVNDRDHDGYVAEGNGNPNKVWKTDANGNPAWRSESGGASYPSMTQSDGVDGTSTVDSVITPQVLHDIIETLDDDTTYTLSIHGNILTLTSSDGSHQDITLPYYTFYADSSTTLNEIANAYNAGRPVYYMYWEDVSTMRFLPLVELEVGYHATFAQIMEEVTGITAYTATVDDNDTWSTESYPLDASDTTYTISISGHTITLTPSTGVPQSITVPDDNTTYTISRSGGTVTLTGSDGSTSTFSVPTALSDLTSDSTHRVVTDAQIAEWDANDEVYIATYGTTSYSDLTTAINTYKLVFVSGGQGNGLGRYIKTDNNGHHFIKTVGTSSIEIICSTGSAWSATETTLQTQLVSGTNIKTINGNSVLGSGDLVVGGSGTDVPTADEVAEFDSTAHMNSTDMTDAEVDAFIANLNIGGGGNS